MDVFKALRELDDRSLKTRNGVKTMQQAIMLLVEKVEVLEKRKVGAARSVAKGVKGGKGTATKAV